MIRFPLEGGGELVVIEPGNIARLKSGKPMHVGNSLIAFTPDLAAFVKLLGVDDIPGKGEPVKYRAINVTPEQFQEALDACQSLPEVLR
jgi:hypothetical protein